MEEVTPFYSASRALPILLFAVIMLTFVCYGFVQNLQLLNMPFNGLGNLRLSSRNDSNTADELQFRVVIESETIDNGITAENISIGAAQPALVEGNMLSVVESTFGVDHSTSEQGTISTGIGASNKAENTLELPITRDISTQTELKMILPEPR